MKILAKYHANGDLEDELIRHEYNEICLAIQLEEENSRVRFIDFLKTPGNRRRLLVLITMATGTVRPGPQVDGNQRAHNLQNWVGNSIISYYLAPVLKLAGITDYTKIC